MVHDERRVGDSRSLWVLLILVAVFAAGVITSCGGGGGGGGSDGELCDQCGDDPDGPCRPTITIVPVVPDDPNDGIPKCVNDIDATTGECIVELTCRRKVDSGQRRCYPLLDKLTDPQPHQNADSQFRCDGSRPGGTPKPPEPTNTTSPGPTATAVPQTCGNGIREGTEECDSPDLAGETCESQGCGGGTLSCQANCQGFNFSLCTGIGCAGQ
jgi:hypothetical protein